MRKLDDFPLKAKATATSVSKEEGAFGFGDAIADRAALLAGGADHAELKSDYDRFCQTSGTRNMKLEGVRCPESQVGHKKLHKILSRHLLSKACE